MEMLLIGFEFAVYFDEAGLDVAEYGAWEGGGDPYYKYDYLGSGQMSLYFKNVHGLTECWYTKTRVSPLAVHGFLEYIQYTKKITIVEGQDND